MRGKGRYTLQPKQHSGITPAYAGKSACNIFLKTFIGDHPRLCGEKLHKAFVRAVRKGSPPPMRGKVAQGKVAYIDNGITPAYAGKRC